LRNAQALPELFDLRANIPQSPFPGLFLVKQPITLGFDGNNIVSMETELFGGVSGEFDNVTVGLSLRCAQFGPKVDDFGTKRANGIDTFLIFVINACEFVIQRRKVGMGQVE